MKAKAHDSKNIAQDRQNREGHDQISEEKIRIPSEIAMAQDVLESKDSAIAFNRDIQQLREQLLIVQADFDNFRKRSVRDQEEIRRLACASIIQDMLPILDNFEIGLKSAKIDDNTRSGFQIILSQLQALLREKGVQEIAPLAVPFDPLQQEAVAYIHHGEVPQEYVVETVRKGYLLNDRLLRPASVIVSKGKASEEK
jgi:molecular chaperone GrpE